VCAPDSAAHILVCFADAAGHVPQLSRREGSTEVSISHEHLEVAPFRLLQYSLVGSNVAAVDEVGVLWFPVACADNLGAMTEDKICGLHGARTNIHPGQKARVWFSLLPLPGKKQTFLTLVARLYVTVCLFTTTDKTAERCRIESHAREFALRVSRPTACVAQNNQLFPSLCQFLKAFLQ
jgi:hypothetical protein